MGSLPANQTVNGFALEAQNPKIMYVAMRGGLFKSTDGGETWKPSGKDLKNLAAVAVNPKRPEEIYVSTMDGVIFKSSDGGAARKRL